MNLMKHQKSLFALALLGSATLTGTAQANFVVTAASNFKIMTLSPNNFNPLVLTSIDGSDVNAATIIPGGSGAASGLTISSSNDMSSTGVIVRVVQDYGVFHGAASISASQNSPGNGNRGYQASGWGTFTETLTIPAPAGVVDGSIGNLGLGWDISGTITSCCNTPYGESAIGGLFIAAQTSAPLNGTSSFVPRFIGNGHYDLFNPIQFIFGTPFELTVSSGVSVDIGYDFGTTTPTAFYNGVASASFLNTAELTSAIVSNASGTPLSGISIITSSGRAFPVTTPVPLPATVWLLGSALGGIGFMTRRKNAGS